MLMGDRFPLPINVFTLMETGLYPHPGPSKQPLTVQRGMHIRLRAVNFKRLYASRRAGWLGVVAVVQHQALLLCYDGCRVGCTVLRNPGTVIHYAQFTMLVPILSFNSGSSSPL